MPCKRLSSDVERVFLQRRPGFVEIIHEIEQMFCSLVGTADLISRISFPVVRETNIERLVDENHMSEGGPRVREQFSLVVNDSYGSHFGEAAELRATSGSSLQPNNERNILVHDICPFAAKQLIEHVGLPGRPVPVDLFKT